MHELLATGHALHLETRRQKKLVCVSVLPELGARSCSQVSPITGVFAVAPELVSPLGEEDSAHKHSFGHRETSSPSKEKACLKSFLVNHTPTQSGTATSKDVGRTSRRPQGRRFTRAVWRRAEGSTLTREPRGFAVFSHILSKFHNHTDNRYMGLDARLNLFSCRVSSPCRNISKRIKFSQISVS